MLNPKHVNWSKLISPCVWFYGSCLIGVFYTVCPSNEYAMLTMVDIIHGDHKTIKVGSHHPALFQLSFKILVCMMENVCAHHSNFLIQLFRNDSKETLICLF